MCVSDCAPFVTCASPAEHQQFSEKAGSIGDLSWRRLRIPFFRHTSVYPFPESSEKVANFHRHQVNSSWAVPQTIESSAKICGSLKLPRSYILQRNSSRFLHTWHGTLSGIMTSRKAATAESSCLHAVGCVGCLLGASAEVLSLSISDECQNTRFQISLSSRCIIFIYHFYPSLCFNRGFGEFVHSVTDVLYLLPETDSSFCFHVVVLSFSSATRGVCSVCRWAFDIEIALTNWRFWDPA